MKRRAKKEKGRSSKRQRRTVKRTVRTRSAVRRGSTRDDFPPAVVRHLATEVGHHCSLCNRVTSGPSREANRTSNAGTAAHITGASVRGPRYNENLSRDQRRAADNGIWCCRDCGKLVDDDTSTFRVEVLRETKTRAIERAHRALLSGDPDPDGYRTQAHITRHQIAKQVVEAVDRLRTVFVIACDAWRLWRSNDQHVGQLYVAVDHFRMATEQFQQARDQVRVVWGEHTAAPLQSLGDMCSIARSGIVMDLKKQFPVISDRAFADHQPGRRDHELVLEYLALVDSWAAPYLGREGAIELTQDELSARTWRLLGFPEDQVEDMVESDRLVREAKRSGRSRKEIKALIEQRIREKPAKEFSIDVLGSGEVDAQSIIDELHRVVAEMVERGEHELKIRLQDPFDEALAAALEASPGAIAVLAQQVTAIAKRHASIKSISVTANGLPGIGWSYRSSDEA